MTHPQLQRMKMNLTVDKFFDKTSSKIIDSIPKLKEACANFKLLNLKLLGYLKTQQRVLTGFTINKTKTRQNLTKISLEVSAILTAHANDIKNYSLHHQSKCTLRSFILPNQQDFITRCKNIFDLAITHQPAIEHYGVTLDILKDFQILITTYELAMPSVSLQIDVKKDATRNIKRDLKESLELIKTIDGLVATKLNREPDFHKEYFIARKLPKLTIKTLSAHGTVKSPTGEPIFCNMTCAALNLKRKTSHKGAFKFANLLDGDYEIIFERTGYQAKTARLSVSSGTRTELNIILEKLQPVNP